jgi:clathrin heavy chain
MQLYSIEKNVSQALQGHAGAFALIKLNDRPDAAQVLIFHEKKAEAPTDPPKLFVMEIGRDPSKGQPFRLAPTNIPVPPEAAADFPVSLVVDKKDDIAYLITKMGYLYMFDIHSGKPLFRQRIVQEPIFCTCSQQSTGAIFGITVKKGQVLRVMFNGQAIVPYIVSTLRDNDLAIKLAGRLNLPGAENLYAAEFERLISARNVQEAARLVANSGTALRNAHQQLIQDFNKFLRMLVLPNQSFSTSQFSWKMAA